MLAWMRRVAVWITGQVPTVLTLALLIAVAVWGARHDWKLHGHPLAALWGSDPDPADPPPAMVQVHWDDPKSPSLLHAQIEFPSVEAVRQAGIRVARAEVRYMARYVTAYGMVDYEPGYYAELASRAPGSVWSVEKEIGSAVRKGEVLLLVESAEVGQAKADFLQALSQVETRQKAVQRIQAAGGSVSDATRQETEASLREARIRLFNDQQRLLNFGLPFRLQDVEPLAEQERVRYLRLLGLPDATRRQIDPETLTANLLPMTAPFEGVVVNRKAAPGEVVDPKHVLIVVADVRHLHVDLDVHPENMAEVHVGQAVFFQPDKIEGPPAKSVVSHISPEVNEKSRNVEVHSELYDPAGRLRPHTFGTGRILVEERPQAVAVPHEAVQSDGKSHLIFVRVSDTTFRARPVQPGLHEGTFTEVEGVQPGEEVVTTGSFMLKSELLKDRIGGEE
jgi:cobalt-zinc-cadmium efflux system membrane fusion protein